MKTFIYVMTCIGVISTAGFAGNANATNLEIRGNTNYSISGGEVRIRVDAIHNRSQFTTSGTIHLRLWATETPNVIGSGYVLADINMGTFASNNGQLAPGTGYSNIDATAVVEDPPDGEYYIHLYVSEYPDLSTILDYRTFPNTVEFESFLGIATGGGGSSGIVTLTLLALMVTMRRRYAGQRMPE